MLRSLISFLMVLPLASVAQWYSTPRILQKLMDHPGSVTTIYCKTKLLVPSRFIPQRLIIENQYLFKSSEGLFAGINGTGQLYSLKDSAGYLVAKRVDSTVHMGISFNAANFCIGPKIYSFGGYGFWKENGLLRYYSPVTHEWDIIKTDREIAASFLPSSFWVDTLRKQLYVESPTFQKEGPDDTSLLSKWKNAVWKLDLQTGNWNNEGTIVPTLNKGKIHTPWGNVLNPDIDKFTLYDYSNRKLYSAEKEFNRKLRKLIQNYAIEISFFIDSTLYFGNLEYDQMDSLSFSRKDLGIYVSSLYAENEKVWYRNEWYLMISLFFFAGTAFYFFNNKKKRTTKENKIYPKQATVAVSNVEKQGNRTDHPNQFRIFTPGETHLLRSVHENTLKGMASSVEEMNEWLGLMDKNESLQKKQRNDMINQINQKWSILYKSDIALIERIRLPGDKRNISYRIAQAWMEEMSGRKDAG